MGEMGGFGSLVFTGLAGNHTAFCPGTGLTLDDERGVTYYLSALHDRQEELVQVQRRVTFECSDAGRIVILEPLIIVFHASYRDPARQKRDCRLVNGNYWWKGLPAGDPTPTIPSVSTTGRVWLGLRRVIVGVPQVVREAESFRGCVRADVDILSG